jgi:hypothetical protein
MEHSGRNRVGCVNSSAFWNCGVAARSYLRTPAGLYSFLAFRRGKGRLAAEPPGPPPSQVSPCGGRVEDETLAEIEPKQLKPAPTAASCVAAGSM